MKNWASFLAALVAVSFPLSMARASDIRVWQDQMGYPEASLSGTITQGDAKTFSATLDHGHDPVGHKIWPLEVYLNSDGGDFDEAMAIGRIMRSHHQTAWVQQNARCLSSCILLLAGAETRNIFGVVGIHRPYLESAPPNFDIAKYYKNTVISLHAYFAEMRIPETLADLMASTPPEEMKILSEAEIKLYFPETDPVADEEFVASQADEYGITRGEVRRRNARAAVECARFGDIPDYTYCSFAVLYGVSLKQFKEREPRAFKQCGPDQNCMRRIIQGR
jgi:hypothetical protein